jgi:hypothetical protein
MKTVFRKSLLLRVVVIAGVLASVLHAQDQPQAASPEIKRLQDAFVGE